MSALPGEETVRVDADRCLVDTVTDCLMWQAVIFTLEELASLLDLHKPADLLLVGKAEAFLCLENLPSHLADFLLSSARALFADGSIDFWTQSYVEVMRNNQQYPSSVSSPRSWVLMLLVTSISSDTMSPSDLLLCRGSMYKTQYKPQSHFQTSLLRKH